LKQTRNKTDEVPALFRDLSKNFGIRYRDRCGEGKLETSSVGMEWSGVGLSIVEAGAGVDGNIISPCLLIILIKRGCFVISATLAKFPRNAPSNPPHLHDVHFTAPGADALHL
jgi:hypothetical protein